MRPKLRSQGGITQEVLNKNNAMSTEAAVTKKSPETEFDKKMELGNQNPKPSKAMGKAWDGLIRCQWIETIKSAETPRNNKPEAARATR
jgi:hypothetical protein